MQKLKDVIGAPLELKLRLDPKTVRRIIQRTGCGSLNTQHRDSVISGPSNVRGEEGAGSHKEPAATNTADGYTTALQPAKFLEWRARNGMGSDNSGVLETSKREALSGGTQRATAGD